MQLKNWFSLFLVLAIVTGVSARVIQVSSELEAISELEKSKTTNSYEITGCLISQAIIKSSDAKDFVDAKFMGKWEAKIMLQYNRNGERQERERIIEATSLEAEAKAMCEEMFSRISSEDSVEETTIIMEKELVNNFYNFKAQRWEKK